MINPKIFEILNSSNAVKAVLGSPVRVYPWGRAPQKPRKPYATYEMYNAVPENYLGDIPDIDNKATQLQVFSETTEALDSCFISIRDVIEPVAHITSFQTISRDDETDLYSFIMDIDFWEER